MTDHVPNPADIVRTVAARERELTSFLTEIVSIPSPSCGEKAVAARIAEEMERLGFDEVRLDGLGSVIGRIGSGPRTLVFDGHIDTVDVGNRDLWEFDPFDSRVEDGWVLGRGTVDQKGGVASMVQAAAIWKEYALTGPFTIYVTGTVMEEDCEGVCWQYLMEKEGLVPEFVVLTEPTDLGIYNGHRGRMEIEITVPGVSAHGSAPERGRNAVTQMAPVVLGIDDLNSRLPSDSVLGKGSICVTRISSLSPSLCAVPDSCSIHCDRRLTFGETEESALREVGEIIAPIKDASASVLDYNEAAYTGLRFPVRKFLPAWKVEDDQPLVQAAKDAASSLFDEPPRMGCWTFSTNGVAIRGLEGIPAIGFGPGHEAMAHAPNERIPVDHLKAACSFYALFPAVLSRYLK